MRVPADEQVNIQAVDCHLMPPVSPPNVERWQLGSQVGDTSIARSNSGLKCGASVHILNFMAQTLPTTATGNRCGSPERPPILEATRTLGLNDRMLGDLMNVTGVAVGIR